jgi:hypothetical protein
MPTFDVAHFQRQGQTVVLVVVSPSFASMPDSDKGRACAALEACAHSAGLGGTVVPVWDDNSGKPRFWAPTQWHSFFGSLTWQDVVNNINHKLQCSW